MTAAHRPLVRMHRVAAAVPSVDLDAHVLRPELLELARDHRRSHEITRDRSRSHTRGAISGCILSCILSSNLSQFSLSCNQGYSVA